MGNALAARGVVARRLVQYRRTMLAGRWNRGRCAVCEGPTLFVELGDHPRDDYVCVRCMSRPRRRALTIVLEQRVPGWRRARVHEFAPNPESVEWFGRRCERYTYSHHWPDVPVGTMRDGVRCEDLQRLTYDDASFDVVVTQDVFEHLPDPAAAAAEVARVLAAGGVHVYTVPLGATRPTEIRAVLEPDGRVTHLLPARYHGNPVDGTGALVYRRWGHDIVDFVEDASGMPTELITIEDRRRGLAGKMLDVVVSTKPSV